MRSQPNQKPSSTPAAAKEPTIGTEKKEWGEGETRPFHLSLKQNPRGPRKVKVVVTAGMVTLDLNDPEGNKRRVRLSEAQFHNLKMNPDLDIRPAAAEAPKDPRGTLLTKRKIGPTQKPVGSFAGGSEDSLLPKVEAEPPIDPENPPPTLEEKVQNAPERT